MCNLPPMKKNQLKKIWIYKSHAHSEKAFIGTVVNQTCHFINGPEIRF